MIKKLLGQTGLQVSQLGYGSMGLRGPATWGVRVVSDDAADKFLNAVLDAGINFIDTAPDYGASEERIGRFLSGRREEFVLATKCGCVYIQHADHLELTHVWNKDVISRNLETSLKRLRTDTIDILQFHGGDAESLVREGLIEQLISFRDQGMIRCLGVSSSIPQLSALMDLDVFDTFQVPYSCIAPQHLDLLVRAEAKGVGLIIRGGIAQGGPDAEIQRPAINDVWAQAKLDELRPAGMSRAQFILRYTLSQSFCHTTIVGTCSLAHLAENTAAAEAGPLAADLLDEINRRVGARK